MWMYATVTDGRYDGLSLGSCLAAHKDYPNGPLPSRREVLAVEIDTLRKRADSMRSAAEDLTARAHALAAELRDLNDNEAQ